MKGFRPGGFARQYQRQLAERKADFSIPGYIHRIPAGTLLLQGECKLIGLNIRCMVIATLLTTTITTLIVIVASASASTVSSSTAVSYNVGSE